MASDAAARKPHMRRRDVAYGHSTTNGKKKKVNTGSVTAARLSGRLTLH